LLILHKNIKIIANRKLFDVTFSHLVGYPFSDTRLRSGYLSRWLFLSPFMLFILSPFHTETLKNCSFAAMNYLGHAFLSYGDADILTGNMTGDHVKGRIALEKFPPGIKKGIDLHRKIDAKTDMHPATLRAKLLFRGEYGLYAGAIMDTLYDHFLATDPGIFPNQEALFTFTQKVYAQLEINEQYFPLKFAEYFTYMKQHNWLYNYRTLKGMEQSLNGLARRAMYMPPIDKAYEIFVTNYYKLNQCYFEFIDDMIRFVKIELNS
jgi:acyl carrier protein phosphodiesterase